MSRPALLTTRHDPTAGHRIAERARPMSDPGAAHPPVRADRDDAALILSKVRSPVVRSTTLARPRLLGWLDAHAGDRVRILATEAGYGKTTLLADWARRTPQRVVWYRLDTSDGDWITFIAYLIAAFREETPGFGASTERLLAHVGSLGTTLDQALGSFLAELGAALHERTVVIVDDIHLVNGRTEVRALIERLVERAPEPVTFIFSGRTRPDVRLARLAAQGTIAELDTDRLRFTSDETRDLFAEGYGTPLDADLLPLVEERTEGWAASLQLLDSSIRGREPGEARSFIASLRGSTGPIYEYLAEEVLERQTPVMRTLLVRASLLDRIWPPLVVAALSVLPDGPSADHIGTCLDLADELGLMSRNAVGSASRRFHPLLRDFLHAHLTAEVDAAEIREMHRRVAVAAEAVHWPTAAHHYIEADLRYEAMRVIGSSSVQALGTGAWGPAMELVERMPDVEPSVAVKVLRARSLVAKGDPVTAIELLERLDIASLDGDDRALVRLALANALHRDSRVARTRETLQAMLADPGVSGPIRSVAGAWSDMLSEVAIGPMIDRLAEVAATCSAEGLVLFSGVARHNRSVLLLAAARFEEAAIESSRAIEDLSRAESDDGAKASAQLAAAAAAFELGRYSECQTLIRHATGDPSAHADALAEAAILELFMGNVGLSKTHALVASARARQPGANDPSAETAGLAEAWLAITRGEYPAAMEALGVPGQFSFDPNHHGLMLVARGVVASLSQPRKDASGVLVQIEAELAKRGIERWIPVVRLISASLAGEHDDFTGLIEDADVIRDSHLLVAADAIGGTLRLGDAIPSRLEKHVVDWPERWRPILRRGLSSSAQEVGATSAALLARAGSQPDVERLLAWEREANRQASDRPLARSLARRHTPTIRVHDLGRAEVQVGQRRVSVTTMRRKSAALLLYLASRPSQTATKEQVSEDLWPDLDPDQAANSLHQTLYFLRREIAPDTDSLRHLVEFVPVEGELVYLDADLVHIDSVAFVRQAEAELRRSASHPQGSSLLASYRGAFAPEFEYEEWSSPWRQYVHRTFLRLTEAMADRLVADGDSANAVAVLTHGLAIDPEAIELLPRLVRGLVDTGAVASAREAHALYRTRYREVYDLDPPSFAAILAGTDHRDA